MTGVLEEQKKEKKRNEVTEGDTSEGVVNKFPRGERRTDEVENASWLWDSSSAREGLETVSRTTEEETDESGASQKSYCCTHEAQCVASVAQCKFCFRHS